MIARTPSSIFLNYMKRSKPASGRLRRALELVAVFAALCLAFIVFGYVCPFKRLTGLPCPGCGMTRAYLALLRGDISGAFQLHPLFPLVPLLAVEIYRYARKNSKRSAYVLLAIGALFMLVYIIRLCYGWRG